MVGLWDIFYTYLRVTRIYIFILYFLLVIFYVYIYIMNEYCFVRLVPFLYYLIRTGRVHHKFFNTTQDCISENGDNKAF